MIYFTLPEMINNFKINQFLIQLSTKKSNYFKFPVTFFSVNGNFNFTLWNGELNNNFGQFFTYNDLTICDKYNIPIRLNCSNIFLEEKDLYDEYMNIILKLNERKNNFVEIGDFKVMDYIKEKYPQYHFILSPSMNLYYPFTNDFINQISQYNEFDLIKLPSDYPDLFTLENKDKIEIIINPLCPLNCESYAICNNTEHLNQINYSENTIINKCQNLNNKNNNELFNSILPKLGFKYFSFSQRNFDILFYINFFIKEEYLDEVLKEYNNND